MSRLGWDWMVAELEDPQNRGLDAVVGDKEAFLLVFAGIALLLYALLLSKSLRHSCPGAS